MHLWPEEKKMLLLPCLSHLPASNAHPGLLYASSVNPDKPPWLCPPLPGSVDRRHSSAGSPPALCVHSRRNLSGCGSAARSDHLARHRDAAGVARPQPANKWKLSTDGVSHSREAAARGVAEQPLSLALARRLAALR